MSAIRPPDANSSAAASAASNDATVTWFGVTRLVCILASSAFATRAEKNVATNPSSARMAAR